MSYGSFPTILGYWKLTLKNDNIVFNLSNSCQKGNSQNINGYHPHSTFLSKTYSKISSSETLLIINVLNDKNL